MRFRWWIRRRGKAAHPPTPTPTPAPTEAVAPTSAEGNWEADENAQAELQIESPTVALGRESPTVDWDSETRDVDALRSPHASLALTPMEQSGADEYYHYHWTDALHDTSIQAAQLLSEEYEDEELDHHHDNTPALSTVSDYDVDANLGVEFWSPYAFEESNFQASPLAEISRSHGSPEYETAVEEDAADDVMESVKVEQVPANTMQDTVPTEETQGETYTGVEIPRQDMMWQNARGLFQFLSEIVEVHVFSDQYHIIPPQTVYGVSVGRQPERELLDGAQDLRRQVLNAMRYARGDLPA